MENSVLRYILTLKGMPGYGLPECLGGVEMPDLQQLNELELRDLTMGVYLICQAKSNTKEHQTDGSKYEIMVNKEQDGVLKA